MTISKIRSVLVHKITPQSLLIPWVGKVLGGTCVLSDSIDDESSATFLLTGRDDQNRSQIGSLTLQKRRNRFESNVSKQIFVRGSDTGLPSAHRGLSYPHVLSQSEESLEMLAVGWSQESNVYRNDLIYMKFGNPPDLIQAICISEATDYGIGSTCVMECFDDQAGRREYALLSTTFRERGLNNPFYDIAPYSLKIDAAEVRFQPSDRNMAPKPSYRSVSYPAFNQDEHILLVSARNHRYRTLAYQYQKPSFLPIAVDGPLGDEGVQYASMFSLENRKYVIASLGRYGDEGLGIFEVETW